MKLLDHFEEFTTQWLEGVLRESLHFPADVQISSASAKNAGVGQGFLSEVVRVSLEWSGGSGLPGTVILKIPSMSGMKGLSADMGAPVDAAKETDTQGAFDFVFEVHETECNYYEYCRSHGSPMKCPKAHFTQKHAGGKTGVIVLEDMGVEGMVPHMSFPLNKAQLYQVLEETAKLHAHGFNDPSFYTVQPQKEFKPEQMQSFVDFAVGVCQTLKTHQPKVFGELIDKVMPFMTLDQFLGAFTMFMKSEVPPVMVHGDLWNNNFLFNRVRGAEGEKDHHGDTLLAVIDFQMTRVGLAGEDIAHILLSSVENELWADHLEEIIEEGYYKPFLAHLPRGMPPPITVAQLVQDFKKMSFVNVMMGLATGSSQFPSLMTDSDPQAKVRMGGLIQRMRANLEWTMPHIEHVQPPSMDDIAAYVAKMSLQHQPPKAPESN